jgi:hypothetical protein
MKSLEKQNYNFSFIKMVYFEYILSFSIYLNILITLNTI